jgi:hypothetical protein
MCAKCTELDDRITHYMRLAIHITDELTSEGIAQLIKRMRAEKAALHREPPN